MKKFFSVDPHVRGNKLRTSYANLSEKGQVFYNKLHPTPSNSDKAKEYFIQKLLNPYKKIGKFTPVSRKPKKVNSFMSNFRTSEKKQKNLRINQSLEKTGQELTFVESKEVSLLINSHIQKEFKKAKNRLSRKVEKMNELAMISDEINLERGKSLMEMKFTAM